MKRNANEKKEYGSVSVEVDGSITVNPLECLETNIIKERLSASMVELFHRWIGKIQLKLDIPSLRLAREVALGIVICAAVFFMVWYGSTPAASDSVQALSSNKAGFWRSTDYKQSIVSGLVTTKTDAKIDVAQLKTASGTTSKSGQSYAASLGQKVAPKAPKSARGKRLYKKYKKLSTKFGDLDNRIRTQFEYIVESRVKSRKVWMRLQRNVKKRDKLRTKLRKMEKRLSRYS